MRSSGTTRPKISGLLAAFGALCLGTTAALAVEYKQAPMLDELVKAGTLPPVAERLPKDPRIVTPVEKVGK